MRDRKAGSTIGGIAIAICLAFFATLSSIPRLAGSLDNPHNNVITCTTCHQSASAIWWTDQGTSGGLCGQCHYSGSGIGPDAMSHAISPTYGSFTLLCTQCHNPHYQRQFRAWRPASYVTTGTISSINPARTVLTRNGTTPAWTNNQLTDMVLIPDLRYLNYTYRVATNTDTTITIDTSRGDSLSAVIQPGASFAVTYGGLVKEAINGQPVRFFRKDGPNSFADGDATYDGVCEICHTRTAHFRTGGGAPDQLHTSLGSGAAGTVCMACHKHDVGFTGTNAGCIGCHEGSVGGRNSVGGRFRANSHHVQGVEVTNAHCYQCHWEANDDGTINTTYHGGSSSPGAAVDLVIYGAGTRPTSYGAGTTAIQYTANGTRTEINKITGHCLGCHSDQNNASQPFGDSKTPKQYAWDGTSVAARYNQIGTTAWGKYSGSNVTPKNTVMKAYSAHGNATNNQGGWDLNETWSNTRNGAAIVGCYDCHNSHGSDVSGRTASYTSATANGGILKETSAGKSGYPVTYLPRAGGSADTKDLRNPGASLCLDCHLTETAGTTTPWGYQSTFGASQQVMGYWDSPYFGPGTFGTQQRYSYKTSSHKGGHFGASAPVPGATGTIDGLCTPCHDPHGVSPTLGVNQQYGVPLLKGTWLTAPYKEDRAPANNTTSTVNDVNSGNVYHIDQNTFGATIRDAVTGITQADTQFAGLCLNCHSKNSLTDGANGGTWKSVDRIHESVKGWGANTKHNYPCSKCHAPHNSRLPRLMVTNCLNTRHKGRLANNSSPVLSGSGGGCDQYIIGDYRGCGGGGGSFPGSWSGDAYGNYSVTCHENQSADQSWNTKTSWGSPTTPVLIDETDAACSTCSVTLQWNPSTNPEGNPIEYSVQVDDASDFSTPNYSSGWISGTSWTASIVTNTKWYWRVQARDAVQTQLVSSWSTPDPFTLSDGIAPPAPVLSSPGNAANLSTPCGVWSAWVTFSWNAVPPVADYFVQVDDDPAFGSPNYYNPTGVPGANWGADIGTGTWYWRVGAKDPQNATVVWSGGWSFTVYYGGDCSASCPVLYVWDGTNYAFETDLFSRGILSRKEAGVYVRPNPNDYYLLANTPADKNGNYEIKIVEERSEIDYLDQMKLYAVDYPENRNVYAEPNRKGDPGYVSPSQTLHTVDKTERHPLSAIHLRTGADVAAKIAGSDGNYLVLSEDREYPSWETVEMDLGDLSAAPMIKLIVNGAQAFPTTTDGASRVISIAGSNFYKLEVPDGAGGWVERQNQVNMGNLGEFARFMVIDISDIFSAGIYKIRFSYAAKCYIDSITFDTTADEPIEITEIPLVGAELAYGGFNAKINLFEDLATHVYGNKIPKPLAPMPGNYTRFGNITPLLPSLDDKFVIMGQGEEATIRFTAPAPAAEGMRRQLLFYGNGYYKAYKYANTRTVDPLPFAAMSNFPYDSAVEHYPDDAEHDQYRAEYNTRQY